MKIAIVAPSAVPFCIGGAEKLWWGLSEAINQRTPHQAELIKLPSPEGTAQDLIASYEAFSKLDLSHFDRVISGKYPAWMVQHPHHTCYMLHRLRGLYDTYNPSLSETYSSEHPAIAKVKSLMRQRQDRVGTANELAILSELFAQLAELSQISDLPADLWQFPGPFIREVVHCIDNIALSVRSIERHTAISRNLTGRVGYFPTGVDVSVIYPPSSLSHFERGDYDYLFTVSRLDNAKRLRLLILAMDQVKSPIKLKIAGTGPDAEVLQSLAAKDSRIEFLGFVNDNELIHLYANALAVPYVPYDEDYGLVTIEAMMSEKPVLTVLDAGGPNEFVIDGQTGYSVAPETAALAERIDYLYEHRSEAKVMGKAARQRVESITWESTVARLLELPASSKTPRSRVIEGKSAILPRSKRRMVVATTYPIYPPRGGGQSRVFHLYKNLTNHFDIELISLTDAHHPPFADTIAPGFVEIRIPKSDEHQVQDNLMQEELGLPVTDVLMPKLYSLTPKYVEALSAAVEKADVLVACHPYLYPVMRSLAPNKPIWYEAQDVEISLKKGVFPPGETSEKLLQSVYQVEQQCCGGSEIIFTCSEQDTRELCEIYDVSTAKVTEVANGVDTQAVQYTSLPERRALQLRLGISHPVAMFLGSWHGPNLEAVEHILVLAQQLPQIQFLIVGSVGEAFRDKSSRLPNVGFLGVVDDATKEVVLEIADVALNPITYGSGTNLKMLEYFAAGVPVISTPFGARGLQVEPDVHCSITPLETFGAAIQKLKGESDEQIQARVEAARKLVETTFAWPTIAERFMSHLSALGLAHS